MNPTYTLQTSDGVKTACLWLRNKRLISNNINFDVYFGSTLIGGVALLFDGLWYYDMLHGGNFRITHYNLTSNTQVRKYLIPYLLSQYEAPTPIVSTCMSKNYIIDSEMPVSEVPELQPVSKKISKARLFLSILSTGITLASAFLF